MTQRQQIALLGDYLNSLAAEIDREGLGEAYLQYLRDLNDGAIQPQVIDRMRWELLLPREKELNLIAHYHTIRSELIALTQESDKADTRTLKKWLESPWVRVPITVGSLIKTAELLYAIAKSTGLLLTVDMTHRNEVER